MQPGRLTPVRTPVRTPYIDAWRLRSLIAFTRFDYHDY